MKQTIYTIPISEVFEPKSGCPVCRLHHSLEKRWVEYITGAAMMEPDVRLQTNAQGFCLPHLEQMLQQQNRLSVALLLQTRLEHISREILARPAPAAGGALFGRKGKAQPQPSCFVCSQVDRELDRMLNNLFEVWGREESFRQLYSQQEHLCFAHYNRIASLAGSGLRGKGLAEFMQVSAALVQQRLGSVKENIDAFCMLFDYRSAGAEPPSPQVSAAIEQAIELLTGDPPPQL